MQRYVCQYFSQIIIDAGRNLDDESDLTDFENAHALILEMNKFAPSVLLSVIPQLDEEMKVDVLSIRYMATSVLGQMFSAPNSQLASTYEKIWTNWLDRYVSNSKLDLKYSLNATGDMTSTFPFVFTGWNISTH